MKRPSSALRALLVVAFVLAGAAILILSGAFGDSAKNAQPRAVAAAKGVGTMVGDEAPGRAGVRVYLDPDTGELVNRRFVEEEGEAIRPGPGHWLNTYGEDLLQERIPQGGYMVDLRGRFQSAVVATIDPETDEVEIDCITTAVVEGPADGS
jgi:hypothetical protein